MDELYKRKEELNQKFKSMYKVASINIDRTKVKYELNDGSVQFRDVDSYIVREIVQDDFFYVSEYSPLISDQPNSYLSFLESVLAEEIENEEESKKFLKLIIELYELLI